MPTYTYEFDRSGLDPANLISNEVHVTALEDPKLIMLDAGLFYTESLVVMKDGSIELIAGTDFEFIATDPYINAMTTKETAGAIEYKDPNFVGSVAFTYQCVGGAEGTQSALLKELRDRIDNIGTTLVPYSQITQLPLSFPHLEHLHSVLTGLSNTEVIRDALTELRNALTENRPIGKSIGNMDDRITKLFLLMEEHRQELNQIVDAVTASMGGSTVASDLIVLNDLIDLFDTRLTSLENAGGTNSASKKFLYFLST